MTRLVSFLLHNSLCSRRGKLIKDLKQKFKFIHSYRLALQNPVVLTPFEILLQQ